jgi:predicted MFS family arabinose efflux permease
VWLVLLEAATFGAVNVLLPLRLSRLGASGLAIGLTFVLASGLSASLSTVVGHVTDRRGPYLPLTVGLVTGAPLMALLVVPHSALLLSALMIITLGGPLTFSMIPGTSLMTASAEAVGVSLVLATTLFNLAYALGETLGAPISASTAQATSDFVPLLAIALLMLATAAWALTHRIRPAAQSETASAARSTPSSSAATTSDISTYRAGVCSESPSTICTANPSVSADSRNATPAGSDTDHSPV